VQVVAHPVSGARTCRLSELVLVSDQPSTVCLQLEAGDMTSDGSGSSSWAKARRVATAQVGISRLQLNNRNIRVTDNTCKQAGPWPVPWAEAWSIESVSALSACQDHHAETDTCEACREHPPAAVILPCRGKLHRIKRSTAGAGAGHRAA